MVRQPHTTLVALALALAVGAAGAWWLAAQNGLPAAPRRPIFGPVSLDELGPARSATAAMSARLPVTPWAEPAAEVEAESEGHPGLMRSLDLWCVTTAGYALDIRLLVASTDPSMASDEEPPAEVWSTDERLSPGQLPGADDGPVESLPPGARAGRHWTIEIPITLARIWVEVRVPEQFPPRPPDFAPIVREIVAPPIGRKWSASIDLPVRFGWIEASVDWGEIDPRESSWCSMTLTVNGQTLRLQPASPPAPDGDDDVLANSLPTRRSFIVPRVDPGQQRLLIRGWNGDTVHFETRLVDVRAGEATTLAPITVGYPIVLQGQVLDPEQLGIEACIRLGPALPGAEWVSTTGGCFAVSGELSPLAALHVVPDDRDRFAEMDVTCPPLPARDFRIRVEPRATAPLDLRFRCRDELGNPVIGTLLVTLTRDGVTTVRWVNPGNTPRRCPGSRGCSGCWGWGATEPSDLEKEASFPGKLFDLDPGDHEVRVWHPGRHLSTVTRISLPRPTDEPVTFVLGESRTEVVVPEGRSHVLAIVPAGCEIRQQTWMDQDEYGLSVPRWGGIEARSLRGLPTGDLVDIYTSDDSRTVTVQRWVPAHPSAPRTPK